MSIEPINPEDFGLNAEDLKRVPQVLLDEIATLHSYLKVAEVPLEMARLIGSGGQNGSGDGKVAVEKVQKSKTEPPWWWFSGDTYKHKEVLRKAGARWGRKRQQWFYIGDTLPIILQKLVEGGGVADLSIDYLDIFGGAIIECDEGGRRPVYIGQNGVHAHRTKQIEAIPPTWVLQKVPKKEAHFLRRLGATESSGKFTLHDPKHVAGIDEVIASIEWEEGATETVEEMEF